MDTTMKECEYYKGCKVIAYQETDLNETAFKTVVNDAKNLWKAKCESNFQECGDVGSCVVGAGIYVYYIGKGKRKADKRMIINAMSVSSCQGSLNWEHGQEEIVSYLKENGIDAKFEYGTMD